MSSLLVPSLDLLVNGFEETLALGQHSGGGLSTVIFPRHQFANLLYAQNEHLFFTLSQRALLLLALVTTRALRTSYCPHTPSSTATFGFLGTMSSHSFHCPRLALSSSSRLFTDAPPLAAGGLGMGLVARDS